jgi:hypothetical protein
MYDKHQINPMAHLHLLQLTVQVDKLKLRKN